MKIFRKLKKLFQMNENPLKRRIQFRMRLLVLVLLAAAGVIVLHIIGIVVKNHEEYERKTLAQMNYSSTTLASKSGDILDCNMTPVAVSKKLYTLVLDPAVILETEELTPGTLELTIEVAASSFDLDSDELRAAIEENPESRYYLYGGKIRLTEDQKSAYEEEKNRIETLQGLKQAEKETLSEEDLADSERKGKITGIWFEEGYERYYPFNEEASKIIGFTTNDVSTGLYGLESYYNTTLRGTDGRTYGYLDEDSHLNREVIEPVNGNTIVGTFDMNLQRIISDELAEWFADTDENGELINSAKSVQILAMDPNTGAVKAMVTDTDYNLNEPRDLTAFYTEEEIAGMDQEETREALYEIWKNGIISDTFEPGSTGKVLTFAAALEEGVLKADDRFHCDGSIPVANYTIKCHNLALGGCGDINALEAFANSCNVAFIEIGERLGSTALERYQHLFNLGQKTGIDLPSEASAEGLLYTAEQMNAVELATNAFGQCYNVTMLQLCAAFCSTINGGYYYKPYVVDRILDENGKLVESYEPVLVRRTVSEETSQVVQEALELTVQNGTGGGVQVSDEVLLSGYSFGAKTGTAQKLPRSDNKYIISVISTCPVDDPQLVLYVVIDEYGGELQADSAPAQYLTGDIWGSIVDYMGLYSDEDLTTEEYLQSLETVQDENWENGDSMMIDEDGSNALPEPPTVESGENTDILEDYLFDAIAGGEDHAVPEAADQNAENANAADENAEDANAADPNAADENAEDANAADPNAADGNAENANAADGNAENANVADPNAADASGGISNLNPGSFLN